MNLSRHTPDDFPSLYDKALNVAVNKHHRHLRSDRALVLGLRVQDVLKTASTETNSPFLSFQEERREKSALHWLRGDLHLMEPHVVLRYWKNGHLCIPPWQLTWALIKRWEGEGTGLWASDGLAALSAMVSEHHLLDRTMPGRYMLKHLQIHDLLMFMRLYIVQDLYVNLFEDAFRPMGDRPATTSEIVERLHYGTQNAHRGDYRSFASSSSLLSLSYEDALPPRLLQSPPRPDTPPLQFMDCSETDSQDGEDEPDNSLKTTTGSTAATAKTRHIPAHVTGQF
jgi:hypothetical protein